MSTMSFSELLTNSWAAGGPEAVYAKEFMAWIIWKKFVDLPSARAPLPPSPKGRMAHPVSPRLQNGSAPDWRWNDDKALVVKTLLDKIVPNYPLIPPSAFLEAMELVIHIFVECAPAGRVVIKNMAADTELLFMASFLLIVQAYYDSSFTSRDMDVAMSSRYAGYLKPSAWLSSVNHFIVFDDEARAKPPGPMNDRLGLVPEMLPYTEEFKDIVEAKLWQVDMPQADAEVSTTEAEHESFVDDGDEDVDVGTSLSPRAHQLSHHYRSPSLASVGPIEQEAAFATPAQDVAAGQAVTSRTELESPLRSVRVNAPPSAWSADRVARSSRTTVVTSPSSTTLDLPHPSATTESLAAILANDPNDFSAQCAEIVMIMDNIHVVLQNAARAEKLESNIVESASEESLAAQVSHGPPADAEFVSSQPFPSLYSFASSIGYVEVSPSSTPTLPLSIRTPSWTERVPQQYPFPESVGSGSPLGEAAEPPSLPRVSTGSATLVGDVYSQGMKAKASFATATTSMTGSSTDWLGSWRLNSSRSSSTMSMTTIDSDDSESSGWLADGSSNSHCPPRRTVLVDRLVVSPMLTYNEPSPTLPQARPAVASRPPQSKLRTFFNRFRLPGRQARKESPKPLIISQPYTLTLSPPPSSASSSSSEESERLTEWQVLIHVPDDLEVEEMNRRAQGRWTQRMVAPRTWLVSRRSAENVRGAF